MATLMIAQTFQNIMMAKTKFDECIMASEIPNL